MPICTQFLLSPPLCFFASFPAISSVVLLQPRPVHGLKWHRQRVKDFQRSRRRQWLFPLRCQPNSRTQAEADVPVNKRKIVEHIFLLKVKPDILDVEEKDMLDYLFTTQYQMRGILAISLGRIEDSNVDNFTHAMYMRFQRKEDLEKFYVNSHYLSILKEHVLPYCYESISVDYESEVEDDILPIFRRGEEFIHGVEFVLMISACDTAPEPAIKDAVASLQDLILEYHSIIVQATQGSNFNLTDSEYTHAAVIRFPSVEDLDLFRGSQEYTNMWSSKFQPITRKALGIHYAVDPVGTELM